MTPTELRRAALILRDREEPAANEREMAALAAKLEALAAQMDQRAKPEGEK